MKQSPKEFEQRTFCGELVDTYTEKTLPGYKVDKELQELDVGKSIRFTGQTLLIRTK